MPPSDPPLACSICGWRGPTSWADRDTYSEALTYPACAMPANDDEGGSRPGGSDHSPSRWPTWALFVPLAVFLLWMAALLVMVCWAVWS